MFYMADYINALLKGTIYVTSIVILLAIIKKVCKIKLFKTTPAERANEIGSIWINIVSLLVVSNFSSISMWLTRANCFEMMTVTMVVIFILTLPLTYIYTKYSDIEVEKKEDEASDKASEEVEKVKEDEYLCDEDAQME